MRIIYEVINVIITIIVIIVISLRITVMIIPMITTLIIITVATLSVILFLVGCNSVIYISVFLNHVFTIILFHISVSHYKSKKEILKSN